MRAVLGLVVLVLLMPLTARAQDVRVTVVAVLATSDKDAPVEKELTAIADAVRKNFPDLVGFRSGRITTQSVTVGAEQSFPLVDDEKATVSILKGMDKNQMIRVRVKPPQLSEVTMNCCCGKFVPFVTPYETKAKKERLILAVMVNPCPGK
jgi:hypothetical protein